MKKITTLLFALIVTAVSWQTNAQVLNQPAAWPNAAWSLLGNYDLPSLLSDPTTTTNFSYDDDNAGNGHADTLMAESPVIDLTAAHTAGETLLSVDFDYDYNLGDVFNLEYYDAASSSWVLWEVLPDNSGSTSGWCAAIVAPSVASVELNILNFTPTQLSGFKYRFYYEASVTWGWGVCVSSPTITSITPPACPDPTVLTATNILATAADLGWTENGTATTWDIEWGTAGFVPTGTPTIAGTTTNPHNLTGLTSATSYDFYVRADCGGSGTSTWVGPMNFTTSFNTPVGVTCISGGGASYVFSDDMETATGWTGDVGTGAGQWDFPTANPGGNSNDTGPSGPASGTTFAEFEASGSGTTIASMVTPMIDLTGAADEAELSFYMHAYGAEIGTLNVGVGTSATGPFTNVFSWTGQYQTAATDPWANIGVDISAYLGQQIYIEFSYGGTGVTFTADMAIDLVQVESCVSCPAPSVLAATNITATAADLGWTENGSATNWDIEWGTAGFTPGTGTSVIATTNPHNLAGLSAITSYDFYVRAICGPADTSAWVGPFNFTTPCATM
jgi:hypothetical protein